MNNIYKVIWSKAKNCYVVASEIARSHTKSATGSEKIGGVTRRSLLASLMALSLLCGGLGVAEASVHVNEVPDGTKEVYTIGETYSKTEADARYAKANDVTENTTNIATNKANITALQTTATEQGKLIATNTANIANNTTAIEKKINAETANERFATKDALRELQNQVTNKVDNNTFEDALKLKADTDLSNLTEEGKAKIKKTMSEDMNLKADKTYVDTVVGKKADKATTLAGYEITDAYTKEKTNELLNTKANAAEVYTRGDIDTKLEDVYRKTEVDGKITGEENARNIAIQTAISGEAENRKNAIDAAIAKEVADRNQAIKTEVDKEANARNTAIANAKNDLQTKITEEKTAREALDTRLTKAEDKITANETAIDNLKTKDTENVKYDNATVKDQITLGGTGGTKITNLKDADLSDSSSDAVTGKQLNKTNKDLKTEAQTRQDMDTLLSNRADALEKNTGGITRNDAKDETYIEKNVTVDNQGNIEAKGKVTANGVDAGVGDITTKGAVNSGTLEVTNTSHFKDDVTMDNKLNVTGNTSLNNTDVGGALNVTGASDLKGNVTLGTPNGANTVTVNGTANFNAPVNMANGLNVTNGETKLKNTTVTGDLNVTGTITTDTMVFGVKPTNYTEIDQGKVTSKNSYINGAGQSITSSSTFDVEKNEVGFVNNATGEQSYHKQTAKGINGSVTDKDGNKTYTKVTATENSFQVQDKDGKNTNHQVNTKDSSVTEITDKNGATTTKTEQTAKDITNTAEQGTITNKAQTIVNNATGDMTNTVGGQLNTTVTGQATEEFNGGLDTNVTGTENHTVTGNQNIHVTKNQTNKIDGDQENTIGGKQTTTVDGKVTENYKAGQETNVTGDQDIKVSGTQTTTATDINRNASSGMIDTVENASGSNKETKVAGQTTTDVKLASGEEGHYIRGATESRDYLLNGTLKNSETKTAEATSSEVTDGTNKASTIQDAKNLAGSVTNGTETGISGIHANNDGSVSIDSIVVGGGMSSVINQKKDSIQSAVGDGTNSTVIRQDKDNVAIASSNGTVAIAGKDIVNNASNSITDKVGDNTRVTTSTSITDTVGTANRKIENGKIIDTADDSTVTTENGKGTTFTKTGSTAYSTAAGAPTDTNIAGNHITTGRVDANELGVSDKDGANTADFSVEAGERKGVKASAGNGTTTGSLDVTAEEVSSSVKDASGKGSTFKQRIDAIMMESKEVSIKAEETLTNEAKVITNKASEVINNEAVNINNTATGIINSKASEIKNQADKLISNKVGENTSEYMEDGKITTSVKDGAKSTVTIQNADGLQTGVTNGTSTNASATTATSSAQTIASGNKANSVITTIDGTQFVNTDAAVPVTGASGAGTAVNTTIKGNTITTGKVTMDYADVMKDLGVRGNANITGKTTTGSLEVTGTSTLKGDVTMENNATVGNNLTVNGTTKTKTLNVTENAEVGGELKVAKKATFEDSVSIAKDLTVGGDVTAKSYKVGDKTYISADGINANDQKITNVADGSISEGSKDAVNGGQLYQVKNDLEGKVNKVGANAAAMANLHPMEFDPDSKWNIAAAMGNYGSETATAIGAFYRPNEDVMVNFSTAFGTGENMVGGGVSVRLGKGSNKLSRQESNALKAQVNDLTARMDALLSVLNPNMSKDFPDVPENHWAYEAVSRLAGNDIVQGYPDGEFHGDRTMTRYEMAEIIYNALSRGAEAERELVEEFKPELQAMAASEKATAERAEG